jgi:Ni,Fe-hydrogenase I cytochrome b subunit
MLRGVFDRRGHPRAVEGSGAARRSPTGWPGLAPVDAVDVRSVGVRAQTGPAAWRDGNVSMGVSEIDLTSINVWLDTVFSTLYVVVLIGLVIHFIASVPVGRFRKKWILKQWPEHDEPHPPAHPKIIHFVHLSMMLVLGFTGLYIRFPFFDGARTTMRYIHYVAMIIVTLTLIWRFWYAFGSKRRDWRAFALTKADVKSTVGVLLYYSFISNSKPHTDKYNVMQKFAYLCFALFMVMQVFCGFSLLEFWTIPVLNITPSALLLGWWLAPMTGGLAVAVAWMRVLHYTLTWMFILLTTIHVYLSATEDIPVTLDFFGLAPHGDHVDVVHLELEQVDDYSNAPAPSNAD